jgi:hypothetical protein
MHKNSCIPFLFIFLIHTIGFSQTDPFSDSNKVVKKYYDYKNFSKVSLIEIDGEIEIEVGAGESFKIELSIREKYLPILLVNENNKHLELKFNYTKDNNKYITDPQIKIKISCPNLEEVIKFGNGSVRVNLENQNLFSIYNEGNGNAKLKGKVNELSIVNTGNGATDAKRVDAEYVKVRSSGNGNVIIHATKNATGNRSGNGQIIQKGNAILKLF